jgi:type VI secretion system secreted protein VgrG
MTHSTWSNESSLPSGRQEHAEYRFDCPELADVFSVLAFEATEKLNEPYRFRVELRPEHDATDCYELLGQDASVVVSVNGRDRWFRGIVDRVTVDHGGRGLKRCSVVIVPALFSASRTIDSRIFQDKSALAIVSAVLTETLGPYGRSFDVSQVDAGRLVERNYCVQYRESALDFIHRLCEEEGIGYYFTHDEEYEALILFDSNRGLVRAPHPVRFGTDEYVSGDRLIWLPITLERIATETCSRDYDWRLGSRGRLEHKSRVDGGDARRRHEVYEHGVDHHHVVHEERSLLAGMADALVTSTIGSGLPMQVADRVLDLKGSIFDRWSRSNTHDRGRVRREWHERDARVLEGVSFLPGLSAGVAFALEGHPWPQIDGEYYVTEVTHSSAPPPPGALPSNLAPHLEQRGYHNRVRCLPVARAWRPDRATPKPRIDGVQTAVVTGPPGLDVHTDAYGRILVQFFWDRAEPNLAGDYTCWLRVSQAWAGATSPAFLFVPRVGMEVLVTFIDGDPDRPLVIGCVYNGDNATPALLPAQATKSIIRTRSIPHGIGHNELSFEDAAGMERVYLRAERDLSELVQNDHDVRILHDEQVRVGGTQLEDIGVDQHVRVGRNYRRSIGADAVDVTMGDHARSIGGSARERVQSDYDLTIAGTMTTWVPNGDVLTYAGNAVTLVQGTASSLQMTEDEGTEGGRLGKGLTLRSMGSTVYLTEDRIELRVGDSSIVVTPELVQINGKTLPVIPGAGGGGGEP